MRGLYTYLQTNTIRIKAKNILCVYFTVHIYTQTGGRRGNMGPCYGLWAINDDTIWITYSGEKASKPTEGIKSLPPRMPSFHTRRWFFSSFSVGGGCRYTGLSHAYSVGVSTAIHVRQNDPTNPTMQCDTLTCSGFTAPFKEEIQTT